MGIESLESELEESESSKLVVFSVVWVMSLMVLVSSISGTFPSWTLGEGRVASCIRSPMVYPCPSDSPLLWVIFSEVLSNCVC